VRLVELHRERVVLRRAVRGIKMALNLPVAAYLGVAIRVEPPTDETAGAVLLMLEHRDPALSLTLYRAGDCTEIIAEWRSWGRALGLPLLVAETDGRLREPFSRIGSVRVAAPNARRRRHSVLVRRRPSLVLRRRPGNMPATPVVHRDEREIIARN
jgi:hypothetical protein